MKRTGWIDESVTGLFGVQQARLVRWRDSDLFIRDCLEEGSTLWVETKSETAREREVRGDNARDLDKRGGGAGWESNQWLIVRV